jgi:RNA polymerase subunit RPABC4/transcription elongation factor Spt4
MESITSLIVGAASVIGAILAALLGGLTVWAFRDIRSRTRDPFVQILATIVVGLIPIAGILVYLMLRPRETLSEAYVRALEEESLLSSIENQEFCPTCGRRVDADMQWCPSCHTKLRNACGSCGKAVHLSWDLCPYCGTGLQPELPQPGAKVKIATPLNNASSLKRVATPPRSARSISSSQSTPAPIAESLPADRSDEVPASPVSAASDTVGNVLDRVGGAIGSVVDRVNARIQNTGATPKAAVEEDDSKAPTEIEMPPAQPKANGRPKTAEQIRPQISRDEE